MTIEKIHIWHQCHHCGTAPIRGIRYHCRSCPDGPENDLCENCYDLFLKGGVKHPRDNVAAAAMEIEAHIFEAQEGRPESEYTDWLDIPPVKANSPSIPPRFVVRPIFNAGTEVAIGGYAFVVNDDTHDGLLLLTALHVISELAIKLGIDCSIHNPKYTGRELPKQLTSVDLFDILAPQWMLAPLGSAQPMLVLPNARTGQEEPISDKDIAAFRVNEAPMITPAELAPKRPEIGEPVWNVARLEGAPAEVMQQAVIVKVTDNSMVFRFEDAEKEAKYASGSPVVDALGRIVGIRIGGGNYGGEKFGHANHIDNIRRYLGEAAAP